MEKISQLQKQYVLLQEEYEKIEKILENRYNSAIKRYLLLGMLFFILHTIVFYVLIYHLYGWDTIEPITYIVGNLYWIAGLSFFVLKKKKLDFSLITSEGFKKTFFINKGKNFAFNPIEKAFVNKELSRIKEFKDTLSRI